MPIFAKDQEKIISAWEAKPNKIYHCIGCNMPLKYRRSKLQFPHFYHPSNTHCHIKGKSKKHLLIQLEIEKRINGAKLEVPFPTIGRIGDVVWEKEKIIFEIQCSRITYEEAQARVFEYESLGYKVIWILDDGIFNHRRVRKSELFIRTHHSYYVKKRSFFYDQFEIIQGNRRIKRGKKIPIDFRSLSGKSSSILPEFRKKNSPLLPRLKKMYETFLKRLLKEA